MQTLYPTMQISRMRTAKWAVTVTCSMVPIINNIQSCGIRGQVKVRIRPNRPHTQNFWNVSPPPPLYAYVAVQSRHNVDVTNRLLKYFYDCIYASVDKFETLCTEITAALGVPMYLAVCTNLPRRWERLVHILSSV